MLLTTLDVLAGMDQPVSSADVSRVAKFIGSINDALSLCSADSPQRAAMFLGQVMHECGELRNMRENLNYSADALARLWPNRFWIPDSHSSAPIEEQALAHPGKANAMEYHRQPQKIANKVYANRLGNGDEASGDGWAFRGGGGIQCTGRKNFSDASQFVCKGDNLVRDPSLIELPPAAMGTAAWFWSSHGLNEFADAGNIDGCTTRVNGGTNGAVERRGYYARYLQRLTANYS